MAKPTELSAAATVNINKEYICPNKSSRKQEKTMKLIFKDKIINSNDINILITCFLKINIPHDPIINNDIDNII
jgi:hypothetical protein